MCNKNNRTARAQGFTLVELSIVIIIIGFLIAGIAAGTSLIKQAEINSVVTDLQGYQTAYNNFILRYSAIPGDMKNAETYWPAGATGCSVTATQCNGDGDGLITMGFAVPSEVQSAWRELALANMISAGITVIPTGGNVGEDYILGSTVPVSKVTGAGYLMAGAGSDLGNIAVSPWTDGVTNATFIGKVDSLGGLDNAALKPEDAFNMDKKIDDGTVNGSSFAGANTGSFRSVDAANGTCLASATAYALTETTAGCVSGLALN